MAREEEEEGGWYRTVMEGLGVRMQGIEHLRGEIEMGLGSGALLAGLGGGSRGGAGEALRGLPPLPPPFLFWVKKPPKPFFPLRTLLPSQNPGSVSL